MNTTAIASNSIAPARNGRWAASERAGAGGRARREPDVPESGLFVPVPLGSSPGWSGRSDVVIGPTLRNLPILRKFAARLADKADGAEGVAGRHTHQVTSNPSRRAARAFCRLARRRRSRFTSIGSAASASGRSTKALRTW